MTPYVEADGLTIYVGDVLAVLRELADESVDMVCTSPPYWGLRDYGEEGQLGLEATPEEYVAKMVEVFREVRRVLANYGVCWLNLGDCFARPPAKGMGGPSEKQDTNAGTRWKTVVGLAPGLKEKDLVGIPWMTAFALRADGWWLRSEDIWAKGISFCETYSGSTMPESCRDRPTKSHETVFLLTKQANYYYDQEAIREPTGYGATKDYHAQRRFSSEHQDDRPDLANRMNYKNVDEPGFMSTPGGRNARSVWAIPEERTTPTWEERKAAGATRGNVAAEGNVGAGTQRGVHGEGVSHDLGDPAAGRNVRSVWAINPERFSGAHFATMPTKLAEVCILAGAPELVCAACGKPRERVVESRTIERRDLSPNDPRYRPNRYLSGVSENVHDGGNPGQRYCETETVGWTDCGHDNYRPGRVLDPFLGSGTTLLVARRHGRHGVGIELNELYAEIAGKRLAIPEVVAKTAEKADEPTQLLLG